MLVQCYFFFFLLFQWGLSRGQTQGSETSSTCTLSCQEAQDCSYYERHLVGTCLTRDFLLLFLFIKKVSFLLNSECTALIKVLAKYNVHTKSWRNSAGSDRISGEKEYLTFISEGEVLLK